MLAEWLAEHDSEKLTAVAINGKSVKGSRRPVHLMSAIDHHTQWLLNQLPIAEKSNELPTFAPLLAPLPLAGTLVTADAEHCQRAHARFLVYDKGANNLFASDLFVAKGNQPGLDAHAASKLPGGFPPLRPAHLRRAPTPRPTPTTTVRCAIRLRRPVTRRCARAGDFPLRAAQTRRAPAAGLSFVRLPALGAQAQHHRDPVVHRLV